MAEMIPATMAEMIPATTASESESVNISVFPLNIIEEWFWTGGLARSTLN